MLWFKILVFAFGFISATAGANNAGLERILTHGHLSGEIIKPCPDNCCTIDTSTRLYFWVSLDAHVRNMFLQAGSDTLIVTTNVLSNPRLVPHLSRRLKKEVAEKTADGRPIKIVEAIFPAERMTAGTYTFLICLDQLSWMAAEMTCVRKKRLFERFRKSECLICTLDKNSIRRDTD